MFSISIITDPRNISIAIEWRSNIFIIIFFLFIWSNDSSKPVSSSNFDNSLLISRLQTLQLIIYDAEFNYKIIAKESNNTNFPND